MSRKKYFIEKIKKEGGKLTMDQLDVLNKPKEKSDVKVMRSSVQ